MCPDKVIILKDDLCGLISLYEQINKKEKTQI
jgi:hypothetical protein